MAWWRDMVPVSELPGLRLSIQGGVDMAKADPVVVPIVIHNPKEPEYTRKKIIDFLHSHTAYELIPESGKVTILDVDMPVRQAFHALHEQGIASAALWDSTESTLIGVISASDFIAILKRLRHSVSSGANPMSELEMDFHTIRGLREGAMLKGRRPLPSMYTHPDDDLLHVNQCNMAPVFSTDPHSGQNQCTMASVFSTDPHSGENQCNMAPVFSTDPHSGEPLGSLPLGTWSPDAGVAHSDVLHDSKDGRQWRKLQPLHTVTPSTPLTTALSLLLEAGVSCLPVVDDKRCLLDIYARADITELCKGNAYNRLQWEDVTVGQALSLASPTPVPWQTAPLPQSATAGPMGGLSAEFHAQQQQQQQQHLHSEQQQQARVQQFASTVKEAADRLSRVHICSKDDTLRSVVERLAVPGVRRLIVVRPETRRVEGLISLSDVAAYLFL
eukprot:gene9973-7850_t